MLSFFIFRCHSCLVLTLTPVSSVSAPHYFLKVTGHLGEVLKTREWLVGRITSITERVVEPNVRTA
jgi:hypothetical protein